MLRHLIKKEFLTALRDTRLQITAAVLVALMLTAIIVSKQGQKRIAEEREVAQAAMYDQWVNQGSKHPHSAAHFGQFAFKPKPALSFLDVGLDNYTGVSVFLEAHKQNEVLFSAAQDSNGMTRFGELTAALVLQVLIPLLIIFLTFNIYSKEREQGTLKLNIAQGIAPKSIFMGKVWSTYLIVMLLFLPLILLAFFLLDGAGNQLDPQANIKFGFLVLGYGLYFLVFIFLSVSVSAFAKSSGLSLLALLGIWIISCLVLPKATSNLADKLYPSPSLFEFKERVKHKVKNGIDGHNPSDTRLASLKEEVLNQYGVKTIEELPVNWSGIAMQAGEEYTDNVYDQEFSKIEGTFLNQNEMSEWASFLSPFLAIRNLSMALSGTDFNSHLAFTKAAEKYRRAFVKKMNKDMEVNHKPGVAYGDYKVDREMWASIGPFQYRLPDVMSILGDQWRSISSLGLWLLGLILFSSYTSSRIPTL